MIGVLVIASEGRDLNDRWLGHDSDRAEAVLVAAIGQHFLDLIGQGRCGHIPVLGLGLAEQRVAHAPADDVRGVAAAPQSIEHGAHAIRNHQ